MYIFIKGLGRCVKNLLVIIKLNEYIVLNEIIFFEI